MALPQHTLAFCTQGTGQHLSVHAADWRRRHRRHRLAAAWGAQVLSNCILASQNAMLACGTLQARRNTRGDVGTRVIGL